MAAVAEAAREAPHLGPAAAQLGGRTRWRRGWRWDPQPGVAAAEPRAWEETAVLCLRRPRFRLLPSAPTPASRPRNELEHRRFDSRARIGWVLLFLCFNDSSQPLGMSCAINFLPLFMAAGVNFFSASSFGGWLFMM